MRSHSLGVALVSVLMLTVLGWTGGSAAQRSGSMATNVAELAVRSPARVMTASTISRAPDPEVAPAAAESSVAAAFLADINALRAELAIGALTRDPDLDRFAQDWAETMAGDDALRHSSLIYEVIEGPWSAAGENVGYGPTEGRIFAGLVASPGHHENMVNRSYTDVGIGVLEVGSVVWTVHLFAG